MGGETTHMMYQNPVEEGYSGMRGETTTMMYQNPVEEELGGDAWRDYNYDVPINDGPPPPAEAYVVPSNATTPNSRGAAR